MSRNLIIQLSARSDTRDSKILHDNAGVDLKVRKVTTDSTQKTDTLIDQDRVQ